MKRKGVSATFIMLTLGFTYLYHSDKIFTKHLEPPILTIGNHSASPVRFCDRLIDFDPQGNDTLVFLHIQRTTGTYFVERVNTLKKDGKDLCEHVEDQQWTYRGKSHLRHMYRCPREWDHPDTDPWLLTERIIHIPWICGVHPFYADLKHCLPRLTKVVNSHRNFKYATMLRHPVIRYISEYLLVIGQGATWLSEHRCGGQRVTHIEMPPCYPGYYNNQPWINASLETFLSCDSNWGNNRQVMMLADLEEVGCYNKTLYTNDEREMRLLRSAQRNLEEFSFLGIAEYLEESGILFEIQFGLQFGKRLEQLPLSLATTQLLHSVLTSNMYEKVVQVNKLDMALYSYGLQLFTKRLKANSISFDPNQLNKMLTWMTV